MNKKELVESLSEHSGIDKGKTELFLDSFVKVVMDSVATGEKIQLIGFGTFEKKHREERVGRNPKTGKELKIPAVDVPVFKPGKLFKDTINR